MDDNLNLNTFIAEVERFNRRLSELDRYDSGELFNAWKVRRPPLLSKALTSQHN